MREQLIIREWLNDKNDDDTGAVLVSLVSTDNRIDGTIEIRDCSRAVGLNMHVRDPASKKKRVKKIRRLITALEAAQSFILEADIKKPKSGEYW